MRSIVIWVAVLSTAALAGCVEDGAPGAIVGEEEPIAIDPSLRIEAKDCIQAGGNSVRSMQEGDKSGPFLLADQRPEIGDAMIGAYTDPAGPMTNPQEGIWHTAAVCKTYTYKGEEKQNFGMGFVAQLIQRPDFDTWGDPRIQFLVADLSFSEAGLVGALKDAMGGAEVSPGITYTVEWYVPEKYMHVILEEGSHGTFDFTAEMHKEFGPKADEHIRFWMLPRADGVAMDHANMDTYRTENPQYRPVSVDIFDTNRGEPQMKVAGESLGTFIHIDEAGNHYGNPLGHYWTGFDRTIVIGPAPEGIVYDTTWLH